MRKVLLLLGLAAASLVLTVGPSAAANDTICMGTVVGTHDNVVVPPGGTCFINGATVNGNVKALQDSRVLIQSSTVRGNIIGDKADAVQVSGGTVRENIIIKDGGPAAAGGFFFTCGGAPCEAVAINTNVQEGSIQIEKMTGSVFVQSNLVLNPIRGNIKVEDNLVDSPEFFNVQLSRVAQNLQVFKNRGTGSKSVSGNTVGESLQCFENQAPFFGGGNTGAQEQGQCS